MLLIASILLCSHNSFVRSYTGLRNFTVLTKKLHGFLEKISAKIQVNIVGKAPE